MAFVLLSLFTPTGVILLVVAIGGAGALSERIGKATGGRYVPAAGTWAFVVFLLAGLSSGLLLTGLLREDVGASALVVVGVLDFAILIAGGLVGLGVPAEARGRYKAGLNLGFLAGLCLGLVGFVHYLNSN